MLEVALGILFFSATFWTSLHLLDTDNPKNTFGLALIVGTVMSVFGSMMGPFFFLLPLVALLQLLVRYYDLGMLRSFGVVFLMFALQFGIATIAA